MSVVGARSPEEPWWGEDRPARLLVAGVGKIGERIADRIAKMVPKGDCLRGGGPEDLLEDAIAAGDMLFIATGLEDASVAEGAIRLAGMARRSGVPTLLLATASSAGARVPPALEKLVDTMLVVSPACLVQGDGKTPELAVPLVEEYLVRLATESIIALITERGLICIDFADVKAITCTGTASAALGIGIDGSDGGARRAAERALESLAAQGVDPTTCSAMLAIVSGSTNMTMDDFDDASRVLHGTLHEDASIIVGIIMDDGLGRNLRVLTVAKRDW